MRFNCVRPLQHLYQQHPNQHNPASAVVCSQIPIVSNLFLCMVCRSYEPPAGPSLLKSAVVLHFSYIHMGRRGLESRSRASSFPLLSMQNAWPPVILCRSARWGPPTYRLWFRYRRHAFAPRPCRSCRPCRHTRSRQQLQYGRSTMHLFYPFLVPDSSLSASSYGADAEGEAFLEDMMELEQQNKKSTTYQHTKST